MTVAGMLPKVVRITVPKTAKATAAIRRAAAMGKTSNAKAAVVVAAVDITGISSTIGTTGATAVTGAVAVAAAETAVVVAVVAVVAVVGKTLTKVVAVAAVVVASKPRVPKARNLGPMGSRSCTKATWKFRRRALVSSVRPRAISRRNPPMSS
jgi:hypothetical protein